MGERSPSKQGEEGSAKVRQCGCTARCTLPSIIIYGINDKKSTHVPRTTSATAVNCKLTPQLQDVLNIHATFSIRELHRSTNLLSSWMLSHHALRLSSRSSGSATRGSSTAHLDFARVWDIMSGWICNRPIRQGFRSGAAAGAVIAWCSSSNFAANSTPFWCSTSENARVATSYTAHMDTGHWTIVLFTKQKNNVSRSSLGLHFLVAQVYGRRPPPELGRPKELRAFSSFRHWMVFHRHSLPDS